MKFLTTFKTKTGLTVRVRHIQATDAPHFVDIFEHMSSDSRYRRFHQSLDNPIPRRVWVWEEAERIAHAYPPMNNGLIAFADLPDQPNAPIGAARYMGLEPGVGEVAISVRDDLHGQGIGTYLLKMLAQEAQAAGVRKLVGTVQNSNEAMWRVLNRLDYPITRRLQGTESEIEIVLTAVKEDTVKQM